MSLWYWVRHGPTHEANFVGWRDVPADLSDQAKLKRLTEALPQDAIVVASDLRRASATADAIAQSRHRLPDDPHLREFHLGTWDGLHAKAVPDKALARAFWETPGDVAPPGGESWNMAAARVETAVRRLETRFAGPFVAVAHMGVILTQLQRAKGLSARAAVDIKIDNLSLTTIDRKTGTTSINQDI